MKTSSSRSSPTPSFITKTSCTRELLNSSKRRHRRKLSRWQHSRDLWYRLAQSPRRLHDLRNLKSLKLQKFKRLLAQSHVESAKALRISLRCHPCSKDCRRSGLNGKRSTKGRNLPRKRNTKKHWKTSSPKESSCSSTSDRRINLRVPSGNPRPPQPPPSLKLPLSSATTRSQHSTWPPRPATTSSSLSTSSKTSSRVGSRRSRARRPCPKSIIEFHPRPLQLAKRVTTKMKM